jgi:hypothetical protein
VSHKLSIFCLLAVCFLGMNATLWGQGQARNSPASHEIRGYLDPQTGVFHTVVHPEVQGDVEPATTTTISGKIVVNFTITVDSTIAATTKIGCNVDADVDDAAAGFISESAGVAVARGSGSTVTCSVSIPYSWKLGSASTDTISMTWTITSPVAISTVAAEYPIRASSESLPTIKVPATGTTTTIAVAATI